MNLELIEEIFGFDSDLEEAAFFCCYRRLIEILHDENYVPDNQLLERFCYVLDVLPAELLDENLDWVLWTVQSRAKAKKMILEYDRMPID